MKRFLLTALAFTFALTIATATHMRSGYITAKMISNDGLTSRISVALFSNTGSNVQIGGGELDFGDGRRINMSEWSEFFGKEVIINSESQIAMHVFEVEHTYSAPGTYVISYAEKNRNAGVVNMNNSMDTPFYISCTMRIDPLFGLNNLPDFDNCNFPNWLSEKKHRLNLAAFDSDGDSLSYGLGIPQQFINRQVNEYVYPDDPMFYGDLFSKGNEAKNDLPVFTINSISGDLTWDAPGIEGEYTVLIIVDEWRKIEEERYKIGSISFDMQMIVKNGDVSKPTIDFPDSQCYEEGSLIEESFKIDGLSKMRVDIYTDAQGALINNTPVEAYDFDLWKESHDLIFTYDSKNASKQYYSLVLSLEQESVEGPNYHWSKAFVFGLGCDEILPAPPIVTNIKQEGSSRITMHATAVSTSVWSDGRLNDLVEIRLFDLNGRLVVRENVEFLDGFGQIGYEPIPRGLYIAHLEIDSKLHQQKVLVR